jgi:hypothetical protein
MKLLVVVCIVGLAACGDDGPLECSQDDRRGTYLLRHSEMSGGGCGPVGDQLARLDGDNVGEGCIVNHERWSENDCKLERTMTCVYEADDGRAVITAVSEQKDEEGESITGVLDVSLYTHSTGEFLCSSTYRMSGERQ